MFRLVIPKTLAAKEFARKTLFSQVLRHLVNQSIKQRCYSRFLQNNTNFIHHRQCLAERTVRYYSSNLPNHIRVTLPALSPTMEMGTIISWQKKEGEKLNEGDLLAEIETDKATMGFETPEEGYLAKILIAAGTKDVPIGKLVCIIVENESDIAAFKDFKDDATASKPATTPDAKPAAAAPPPPPPSPPASTPAAPAAAPSPPAATLDTGTAGGRVYASPMAKRLAEQKNIRLQGKGTGLFGAITSSDLEAVAALQPATAQVGTTPSLPSPPPASHAPSIPSATSRVTYPAGASPFVDIPVSNIRRTIAKRLLESKQTIPHYYLTAEINVNSLIDLRLKSNKKLEKSGVKLSLNDFIIKAVAVASQKVPEANSVWMDNVIRQYKNVDVSVAVSTDTGLITPIVHECNNKGVIEISQTIKELAAKARAGKLQPQEFQGGTISISNLGMFGVDYFSAIINPPQSCILAIGTTVPRLVADSDNEKGFSEAQFLTATLSCDHRVVDGAVGAKWLQVFKECLSDPVAMIL